MVPARVVEASVGTSRLLVLVGHPIGILVATITTIATPPSPQCPALLLLLLLLLLEEAQALVLGALVPDGLGGEHGSDGDGIVEHAPPRGLQ